MTTSLFLGAVLFTGCAVKTGNDRIEDVTQDKVLSILQQGFLMKFIFLFIAIILIISFSLSNKKNDDVFTEDIEDENEDEFCAPTKFNPANGAPMIGCFDIYGNTYGVNGAEDIYNNDYSSYENLYEDTTSSLYLDTSSYDSFSDYNFYN